MPANLGQELASLDFANLIGGPLNAIVDAQARSAIATAQFIQQVGFDKSGDVRNTTFRYSRANEDGKQEEFQLTVPFIAMLPIPYVQIDTGEVEFNAKLTSTQETTASESLGVDASLETEVNYWFVKAKIKAAASYKKTSSSTEKVERTYDMRVKVVVKGSDLPSGTERLLNILENSLTEKPTGYLSASGKLLLDALKAATTITSDVKPDGNALVTFLDDAGDTTEYKVTTVTAATTPGTGWTLTVPALLKDHKKDAILKIRTAKTP